MWLTLPFYDFCGFRSVAVNIVYKLQFFTFIHNCTLVEILSLLCQILKRSRDSQHIGFEITLPVEVLRNK